MTMIDVKAETIRLLRKIELEHHHRGWVPDGEHEPPIYSIHRTGDELSSMQMPVPSEIWQLVDRVGHALRALATVFGMLPPVPGVIGIAIMTEGFSVTLDEKDPEKTAERLRASREHRIHSHPDRREIRIVQAVVNGQVLAVSRVRGEAAREHVEGNYWTGNVTDSLRILYDRIVRGDDR